MSAIRVFAGMLLAGAAVLQAQNAQPAVHLSFAKQQAVVLSVPAGAEIYVRPTSGGFLLHVMTASEDFFAHSIDRVTLAGSKQVALDVPALTKAGKLPKSDYDFYYLMDYCSDPRGGLVALLAWHQPGDPGEGFMHVTRFAVLSVDEKGELRSLVKLNLHFTPVRVAAFSSGSYLVAGYEKESLASLRFALLDAAGKATLEDVHPFGTAKQGSAVDASGALLLASGSDDRVYLYSSREPESILKLSSDGKSEAIPIRKLATKAGETVLPMDIFALNGQLILHRAVYSKTKPGNVAENDWSLAADHVWSVYDAATRKLVENYDAGRGSSAGLLAGYERSSFHFLDRQAPAAGATAYTLLKATP